MKVVILASGMGTRLWPVSTQRQPKQFTFLTSKQKSMLRLTYDRIKNDPNNQIFVAIRSQHQDLLRQQIPEIRPEQIIIDPKVRDTANLIILTLDYLKRQGVGQNETIAFVPADHHINDQEGFCRSLRAAEKVLQQTGQLCLIGVEPGYPATQFGYIERGELQADAYYQVKSFREKPDYETALKYVSTGRFYWNCGIFVANLAVFETNLQKFAPWLYQAQQKLASFSEFNSEGYQTYYGQVEAKSIDYALIEKIDQLAVINAGFDWMDVGSFRDICSVMAKDANDNYVEGDNNHLIDVKNSYVRNQTSLPVAVIGLDNVAVINTEDGLLVTSLSQAQKAGQIAKEIQKSA